MTRKYTRWIEDSPDTLDAGTWTLDPRTRVLRWVADPDAPAPPAPKKRDLSKMIACPTCRARADQSCKSPRGLRVKDHGSRLIPRMCRCGNDLAPRRRYCEDCGREADLASRRESQRRIRAAKKTERIATVTTIGWAGDEGEEGAA